MTHDCFLTDTDFYGRPTVFNAERPYHVYVGNNRWFAAEDLNYTHIEAYVITGLTEGQQIRIVSQRITKVTKIKIPPSKAKIERL